MNVLMIRFRLDCSLHKLKQNKSYVSGVVLANASLDIAFHDTVFMKNLPTSILKNMSTGYLGQNEDFYLINAIKEYFEATNIIRNTNSKDTVHDINTHVLILAFPLRFKSTRNAASNK
ncbi:hypothetical protein HYFRA_00013652 [Hymenoscyphus fraxineus]|uniref:Uncharacterized protein n=1 Tax=Hymenoscyphus fraxineus TaxID=746836 RepID=A0A9N9LAF5_9HELO|nr:hypothetical protein HYFRA_00013652 [Hymenoscyphus fraxineus]